MVLQEMTAFMQGGYPSAGGAPDYSSYGHQPYERDNYGQQAPYSQQGNIHDCSSYGNNSYDEGYNSYSGGSGGCSGYGSLQQHQQQQYPPQQHHQQIGYGCGGIAASHSRGQGAYGGDMVAGQYGANHEFDGDGYANWRQEYSVGAVPEYQADVLWTAEATDEMQEVHVFGPSGEQIPPAVTSFDQAARIFQPEIIQRLHMAGFTSPTPIQAHTWAIAAAGRDVIGIAKTGSGKTLAFLLPGFLRVQARTRVPVLCVLAPTRELACQIEAEAEKFGRHIGIRTACCYGGAPRGQQLGAIRRGAQIIVACPGRLNDFIQSAAVSLSTVEYLVLDEADRMLDMGFEPQIRQVMQQIPSSRQTLLFTATWPREVRSLASEFLTKPIHVQTGAVDVMTVNKDIQQHVMFVADEKEKANRLLQILQSLSSGDRCLIFCEMKKSAEVLACELMQYYGVPAVRIHGDLAQYERTAALEAFKTGRSPIMVATDVAARGIDVKGVTVVINFDASSSSKDYVHRIGRTGRAGQKGTAYTFLLPGEEKKAQEIAQVLLRSNLPIPPELEVYVQRRRPGGGGKGKGRGSQKGGKGGRGGGGKGKGFASGFGAKGGGKSF